MKFKTKIIVSGLYGAIAAAALQAAAGGILTQQPLPSLLPASGAWMRGDTHVHDDHSSDGSLLRQTVSQGAPGDLSEAMQIGEGERAGLDYMPLTDHRTYDQQYDPEWESSRLLLVPGEEANGYPHATILGSVDNVVQGAVPPGSDELRVVQSSLWDAHAQGAFWGTAHPDDGELNTDGSVNDYASAVGIDTIENWNRASSPDTEIDYAETRWNRGYRTGISGGSDDHFKQLWLASLDRPGTPDTAVYAIPGTIRSIVQGLWAGHTRLDSGLPATPSVSLVAEMQGSDKEWMGGDEIIAAPGTPGKLLINVSNGFGHQVLVYKSPGRSAGAYASFTATSLPLVQQVQTFTVDITAEAQPTWYRVEVRGAGAPSGIDLSQIEDLDTDPVAAVEYLASLVLPNQLCAVTAPVYISTAPVEAQPEIPLPADQGQADGAIAALGAAGGFAGFPAIANTGGVSHVVAEAHGDGTTAVMYTRIARNGIAAPVDLTSAASSQARFPKVAAQGNDVWVVWQDERAGERPHRPAIYLRHSSNGGLSWQPEQLIRSIAGRAEHPVIALSPSGQPLLAWQEISAGNPFDVMAQQLSVDAQPVNLSRPGKTFHAANLYDTRSALYPASVWPAVAVSPSGELAVAWQDDRTDKDPLWTGGLGYTDGTDPDNWQIMVVSRQPGASGWNAPASLGADTQADRHPALSFSASGRLVAAWDSKVLASSGANLSVLSAWSEDGGSSWTAPAAVALDQNAMSQRPALDRNTAGDAMLVWYDSRSADWRWRVMSATLSQSQGWSPATTLPSPGNNTWPAVSNGAVAFAGTRNAQRLQRDHTQQIFYLAP
jgi:hypothetical protein